MKKTNFLEGQKILIAEDDENSYYLLQYILSSFGADIIHTETGEETVKVLLENPDACLILMDIRMPGISGLETTRRIREFNKEIPILAQTALVLHNERKLVLEAGCNELLLKPIGQDLLLNTIEQLLIKAA